MIDMNYLKQIDGLRMRLRNIAKATRNIEFRTIIIIEGDREPHRRVFPSNHPSSHIAVGREWLHMNTTKEEKTALAMRKLKRSARNSILLRSNVL
jgi:hypothetical protein